MPADMDRIGMKDSIWICTFEEFKGLSAVLRQSLIQISQAGTIARKQRRQNGNAV